MPKEKAQSVAGNSSQNPSESQGMPTRGLSTKKYYIPFRIRVWVRGEKEPILNHTLDLKGKEVQIKFPVGRVA